MGALRVPAETRVHERLHADQGGPARDHVWNAAREVLHFGESMFGHKHRFKRNVSPHEMNTGGDVCSECNEPQR